MFLFAVAVKMAKFLQVFITFFMKTLYKATAKQLRIETFANIFQWILPKLILSLLSSKKDIGGELGGVLSISKTCL